MTKILSVEERVESLQVTSKLETNERYLERIQKIMKQDRLALLQALYDELEGKKRKGIRWTNNEIATYNVCLQDQQDNLQALMDNIRV